MIHEICDESDLEVFMKQVEISSEKRPNVLSPHYNDHGNAEWLVTAYGSDLKYCHPFKKWLVWDGKRWAVDETGQARKLAKKALLKFLSQAIERGDDIDEEQSKGEGMKI